MKHEAPAETTWSILALQQVDDSAVVGNKVKFVVQEKAKGGLLIRGLKGDFFRVWEEEAQVRPGAAGGSGSRRSD